MVMEMRLTIKIDMIGMSLYAIYGIGLMMDLGLEMGMGLRPGTEIGLVLSMWMGWISSCG